MLLGLLVQSFPPLLGLNSDLVAFQLLNCGFVLLLQSHKMVRHAPVNLLEESKENWHADYIYHFISE